VHSDLGFRDANLNDQVLLMDLLVGRRDRFLYPGLQPGWTAMRTVKLGLERLVRAYGGYELGVDARCRHLRVAAAFDELAALI
jgi:hypothetical protein